MKSQGSCKIGNKCFSSMIVTTQGQVKDVVYQKQHYGHDMDVGHLTLTDKEKAEIAGKLSQGVPIKVIMKDIRTSISGPLRPLHLLERPQVHNIKRQFNITYSERCHQDDHRSVGIWAQVMMSQDNSLVKLFKQQGMADPTGQLSERDFALVLMTEPQQELLQKLGTDKICIDSTHGTTGYDFLLTTLLVVDEFGSGVPCAYLLSNRADAIMMKIFFEAVREAVGVISAKVFMSDDASEFYNAWSAVMSPAERQLLCTWHVDKNWKLNIRKLVEGQELMASVYKAVRVLLECQDQEEFEELLKAFVDCKDPSLKLFLDYFKAHYAKRPHLWAFCYRKGAGINTNMYIEAMHKTLKHCYLEGKKNKRVDKLISALIDMTYDKLFQRLVKLCKGKPTTRIARINRSHLAALKMDVKDVLLLEGDAWSVKSQSINSLVYRVSRVQGEKCKGCHLQCEACKTCVHDYTCTCLEHVACLTICGDCSKEAVRRAKKLISDAVEILAESKDGTGSFPEVTKEPANKLVEKLKRFHSTKKPGLSAPEPSLAKPTVLQKEVITQQLLDNDLEHIDIHTNFDHLY
ncbi:uncharacterized protein LOC8043964 [Ixodes scapularis]|uniref:uncharacterized protein LOC8043964 n=1 Tax=Ixodes scapularis TaxID=6945 RepID=UPI001C388070|nr:uncharacterized protein LOC8043964 [Ixodes scapularis]